MNKERIELLKEYAQGCKLFASLLLDLPDIDFVEKTIKVLPADDVADWQTDMATAFDGSDYAYVGACASNCVTNNNSCICDCTSDSGGTYTGDCATDSDCDDVDKGISLVDAYIKSCVNREAQDILQEILVDRARLLCGLTKNEPRPPYESLYMGAQADEATLLVSESYRDSKCQVAANTKDVPDHLGVEMSFVAELCMREANALEFGDVLVAKEASDAAAAFMVDHLGLWATSFADEMINFATTDFYLGVAYLLKSFINDGKILMLAGLNHYKTQAQ